MSDFAAARQKMVDGQVRPSDVTDARIIDAMLMVPREAFVPESRRALAYLDLDLDIGEGGAKRYLIKPAVLAKMLQAAGIKESDRVLVVGCATGYTAAVVAARLAGQVFATESDPVLGERAATTLAQLGYGNVKIRIAPATDGTPADGPFDVIVLQGATEVAPKRLYEQLSEGGRLVGVFANSLPQRATIVTRAHGEFGNRVLFDAAAPVLPGLERTPAFVF